MQQIIHPTKEQVRAYMQQRVVAHRPPPTPAEIRRQLSWSFSNRLSDTGSQRGPQIASDTAPGSPCLFLPAIIGQLFMLLALEWLMCAATFSRMR